MRRQGWETEFYAALQAIYQGRRFKLGDWDCAIFTAEMIRIASGRDVSERLRGQYKTELGAWRFALRNGGSVSAAATMLLGIEPCRPALAKRGDPVLIEGEWGEALGICDGYKAVFLTPDGVETRPTDTCLMGWLT